MNEAELFGPSESDDGSIVMNKTLMNEIAHGTHNTVAICDIFDCTWHMDGGNTKNYKFISDFMKRMMNEIDPRK